MISCEVRLCDPCATVCPCAPVCPVCPVCPGSPRCLFTGNSTGTVPVTVLPSSRGVPPSVPGGDASSPPAVWGNEKAWLLPFCEKVKFFISKHFQARRGRVICHAVTRGAGAGPRPAGAGRRIDRHNGRDSETPTRQRASRLSEPSENDSEKAPLYLKRSRKNTACVRARGPHPAQRGSGRWHAIAWAVARAVTDTEKYTRKITCARRTTSSHRRSPHQTRTRETSHSICNYASSSPCTIIKRTSATGESPAPPKLTRARSASGFAGCARARDSSGRLAAAGVGVF